MPTPSRTFNWRHLLGMVCCAMPLAAWAVQPFDINTATEADLDSLKGVGPATTARVLAERNKAAFTDWADVLARVKGIKTSTASRLSAQGLTVNGQTWMSAPKHPPAPTEAQ